MAPSAYKRASLILQKAKGPKWKRELVSDHKFDFMDVDSFRDTTCLLTIRYALLICSVIISTLVYGADLWSAGILLIYDHWSLSTQPKIPFEISKWIYVGCIIISFMLLAWEIRKTRSIMDTRDISLAVTNPLAYKTYSLKSYTYFCLLQKIKNSTKWSDVIIFYVFYTLKGWKKIIIAQGPRQIIAGFTVYAMLSSALFVNGRFEFSKDWDTYGKDWPQRLALLLMSFTCVLWILSALQIFLAVLLYFPILCHIQGNLKEYCCHKIDKRIDELLEKQRKKRIKEMGKYANSISSKKSKKSTKKDRSKFDDEREIIPTLPTLPIVSNVSNYASEKKDAQWFYRQPQQQNSFNYYDSQPMTPLESSYSLQRNPTKYSPYDETFYSDDQGTNLPSNAYVQQKITNEYYYAPSTRQQYSNNIASPPLNNNSNYYNFNNISYNNVASNKPNTYDDVSERNSATTYNITDTSTYSYNPATTEPQSQSQFLFSNSASKLKPSNNEDFNNQNYPEVGKKSDINNAFWNQDTISRTNRRQEVNNMQDDSVFANYNDSHADNTSIQLQNQHFHHNQQYFDNTINNTKKENLAYSHYI